MIRRQVAVFFLVFCFLWSSAAPLLLGQQGTTTSTGTTASTSSDPIERIKDEGLKRSQVMQTLSYLTDVIGPRLTNSPGMNRSNEWTRDQLAKWGLQNSRLEPWGPFGRGWTLKRFTAQVLEPVAFPLIAYPKAWSPGTNGPITARVVYVDAANEEELMKFKGRLKDAIVLTMKMREVKAQFDALGSRRDEKNLLALANAADPRTAPQRRFQASAEQRAAAQFSNRKLRFFQEEGAALLMDFSRGDGGTVFVGSAQLAQTDPDAPPGRRGPRPYEINAPKIVPQVVLAVEHYNRIARIIRAGHDVKMEVDLGVEFQDSDLMAYNTVAEIPGTDLKDEIVMLGGHMDSWHSGTGATDNGAGVAVAMEAVRIIQALNLKPRRTIRIALWSGEEQGLLGSRAYVADNFGRMEQPVAMGSGGSSDSNTEPKLVTKPDYEKISAYFNLDNGTGRIRGVYLQGNEAVRSIFREWLTPFHELGASTLTIANTGGTDHLPFDAIGIPGFQFIQDEIEYSTRTHHSNQDVFDRIQEEDMKQAATIMAAFVYNTAMRDEKLPRKSVVGNR